jgi:hypothetical protein
LIGHIDEGVAHVAAVGCIDWQLEKILAAQEILVNEIQQHRLRVLIGNVFDHK